MHKKEEYSIKLIQWKIDKEKFENIFKKEKNENSIEVDVMNMVFN